MKIYSKHFSQPYLEMENRYKNIEDKRFYIDLDKIIRSRNSRIARNLPQFLINFLKKLVRQDEINRQLDLIRIYKDLDFIKAHAELLDIKTKIWGIENLPDSGRFIFACNHPLGAVDFYAALIATREKYPVVKAIANDVLLAMENIRSLLLPVNAFGRSPEQYHQIMRDAYESDIQIMTFPAGEVSRRRNGEIKDGNWHRSFIRFAIEYGRDVIPVYIHAKNSERFYRIDSFRRKLGIKFSLELFLLPGEMFRQKGNTIHVVIGKPIPYQTFDNSKSQLEWAQEVKAKVYHLKTYANFY